MPPLKLLAIRLLKRLGLPFFVASVTVLTTSFMTAEATASSAEDSQPGRALHDPAAQALTRDELKVFATNGSKLLDTQVGDLTGEGSGGALVVLDHDAHESASGQKASRTLMLVARDSQGHLQTLARNDKMIPCARCGGVSGDPYSYSRLTPGRFTVVTEGGSREHWWNEFSFKYAPKLNTWILDTAVRGVTDKATGRRKQINLTGKNLGVVKLNDFDPSSLPQVKLK